MALYKYESNIQPSKHEAFDKIYTPGQKVPYSGIYKCQSCGNEIASNAIDDDVFPPENHHQHKPEQGKIRWRLIVATE